MVTFYSETGAYGYRLQLDVWEIEKDVAGLRTKVGYTFRLKTGNASTNNTNTKIVNLDSGDPEYNVANKTYYRYNETYTLTSGSTWIKHNSDGTKSMSVYAYMNNLYTPSAMISLNINSSMELTPIKMKAELTECYGFDSLTPDGATIMYNNPVGDGVQELKACIAQIGGSKIYADYRDVPKIGNYYNFVLTETEINSILEDFPEGEFIDPELGDWSVPIKYVLRTKLGDQYFYSERQSVMDVNTYITDITIPPIIVETTQSAVDLLGTNEILLGQESNIGLKFFGEESWMHSSPGATITRYHVIFGDYETSIPQGAMNYTGVIPICSLKQANADYDTSVITIIASNTQGRTKTFTIKLSDLKTVPGRIIEYEKPSILVTGGRLNRLDELTRFDAYMFYYKIMKDSNDINQFKGFKYRYKKTHETEFGEYININDTPNDHGLYYGYGGEKNINITLSKFYAYDFEFVAEDSLFTEVKKVKVPIGTPSFFINPITNNIGVNCIPPQTGGMGGIYRMGSEDQEPREVPDYKKLPDNINEKNDGICLNINNGHTPLYVLPYYPVGRIIETTNPDDNPNTLYPGQTWELFGKGRTTICIDENNNHYNTIGQELGLETITLTVDNIPLLTHDVRGGDHTHIASFREHPSAYSPNTFSLARPVGASANSTGRITRDSGAHTHTINNHGKSNPDPFFNVGPYTVVYRWRRIS